MPAWPKDALRISFGIIRLIDAILKWLPGFRASYMKKASWWWKVAEMRRPAPQPAAAVQPGTTGGQ